MFLRTRSNVPESVTPSPTSPGARMFLRSRSRSQSGLGATNSVPGEYLETNKMFLTELNMSKK